MTEIVSKLHVRAPSAKYEMQQVETSCFLTHLFKFLHLILVLCGSCMYTSKELYHRKLCQANHRQHKPINVCPSKKRVQSAWKFLFFCFLNPGQLWKIEAENLNTSADQTAWYKPLGQKHIQILSFSLLRLSVLFSSVCCEFFDVFGYSSRSYAVKQMFYY